MSATQKSSLSCHGAYIEAPQEPIDASQKIASKRKARNRKQYNDATGKKASRQRMYQPPAEMYHAKMNRDTFEVDAFTATLPTQPPSESHQKSRELQRISGGNSGNFWGNSHAGLDFRDSDVV